MVEIETGEHKMRYCGNVRISIVLKHNDEYECVVADDEDEARVLVNPPARLLTVAIDSDEAFDLVARAALAFVIDEKDSAFEGVHADDHGFKIERSDPND